MVDDVLLDDVAFQSAAQEQARLNATTTPGQTRAMVIRAYPRPWHVFVDISDDEDADFEVAQTFVSQPTQDEVNDAIIECLEGSEMQVRTIDLKLHNMSNCLTPFACFARRRTSWWRRK